MTRYEHGFITKCAEYGLDTAQSVALLKAASKDKLIGRYKKIVQTKTGKRVKFLKHDPSSDTYSYVDDKGKKYHVDLEDPNDTVY